jgi:hypothetical protein
LPKGDITDPTVAVDALELVEGRLQAVRRTRDDRIYEWLLDPQTGQILRHGFTGHSRYAGNLFQPVSQYASR